MTLLEPIKFTVAEAKILLFLIEEELKINGDVDREHELINLHMQIQSIIPGSDLVEINSEHL